jgi:predicted ABC-type sugar transport system permease subunit
VFPGFSGLVLGVVILLGIGTLSYFTKKFESYNLDPKAKPGTFEPFLVKYIRAAEFIIGLATGSSVLLVGSSTLHAQGGRLPWFYASQLVLLGWCVIYGVAFIV